MRKLIKKKIEYGFTLLEVLGVLILLSIIAVIAVPRIVDAIIDARIAVYVNSTYGVARTAEHFVDTNQLSGNDIEENVNLLPILNVIEDEMESGEVILSEEGEILVALQYGPRCYIKVTEEVHVLEEEDYDECLVSIAFDMLEAPIINGVSSAWFNTDRTVTIDDSSTTPFGVQETIFRIDGGEWLTYEEALNFYIDKDITVEARTIDVIGNESDIASGLVRIDKTPPTCQVTTTDDSWTSDNVIINGICDDSGSGCTGNVTRTFDSNVNGEFSPGEVCDNAGNCTTCDSVLVRIDKTEPTISCTPNSQGTWTNEDINVYVEVDDVSSGYSVVRSRNSTNSGSSYGSWTSQGGSFSEPLTTNGRHMIQIEAISNSGLSTTVTCGEYRIDKTAPTCSTSGGSTTWFNTNRTLTGTCSDTGGSGCSSSTVTRTFTSNTNSMQSPGQVCDNAGNCTSCPTVRVRIDKTSPTCSTSGGSTTWFNTNRTLTGTCSDTGGSGCASSTVTSTFTSNINAMRSPGSVCDRAGNCTSCPTARVRIDKTTPSISFSPNGNTTWRRSQSTTLSGSPGSSGQSFFRYIWSTASSGVSNSTIQYNHTSGGTRTNSTGTRTIYLWARMCDNAGNCRTSVSNGFRLDNTAPSISGITCGYNTSNGTMNIRITATDGHSGVSQTCATVAGVQRCASGTNWISWSRTNPGGSLWVAGRRATDNAGNVSTTGGVTCTVVHQSS